MQDCCRTAPRRARQVVVGLIVLVVVAAALIGASSMDHRAALQRDAPPEPAVGAPAPGRAP